VNTISILRSARPPSINVPVNHQSRRAQDHGNVPPRRTRQIAIDGYDLPAVAQIAKPMNGEARYEVTLSI
jgi:hypothetical protein